MTHLTTNIIAQYLGVGSWPQLIDCRIEDQQAELKLRVPTDLVEFDGHFPQQAVLPGVLQVHWAVKLAQACFQQAVPPICVTDSFTAMQGIKFNTMVLPSADINLSLNYSPEKRRLKFAFHDATQKFSNGDLHFAGNRS